MSEKYNLIFEGNIFPSFDEYDVRQRVSKLLKIPKEQQELFFSGQKIDIRKDLTLDQALRLKMQLEGQGMMILMVSSSFASLSLMVEESPVSEAPVDDSHQAQRSSMPQNGAHKNKAAVEVDERTRRRREEYRRVYEERMQEEADSDKSDPHQPPSPLAFSFTGRYGRMNYLNAILIWFVGVIVLTIVIVSLLGIKDGNSAVFSLLSIIYSICTYRIAVLRAHDLNLSGWLCLLLFVPVLNFLLSVCLLFLKGTDGENHYGAEPNQGSLNVIFLVIVLALVAYIISIK